MNTKNLLLFLPALLLTVFLSTGCEHCTTCSYTRTTFGTQSTYEESYCGEKDELDDFETEFADAAQQQGMVASCKRD